MIKGKWHDEGSAAQLGAALTSDHEYITVEIEDGRKIRTTLNEVNVSDRLGNVERKLVFEDGSVFATHDNDSVDYLFNNKSSFNGFLHKIESHIGWVVIALIVTIATSGAFLKWGVPWTSTKLAHALPHSANELIAANSLEFLDEYFFEKQSDIDPDQIEKIREHFNKNLVPLELQDQDIKYKLHFRKWEINGDSIPNAFALPSGDIILTDKFVELSENQNEIDAVLLHEMGHVVHRHTLQMVIQGTLFTTIIMMVTGDSNGLADAGLGLGSLLVSSSYSRGYESEADIYAFKKMLKANIDPQAFSDIMDRMTKYMESTEKPKDTEDTEDTKKQTENDSPKIEDENKTVLDYLSSHPSTAERIRQAKHYSLCFNEGLLTCPPLEPK